ncbi:hypothetical protein DO233_07855 [Salmonella enterica]|nr:hypothetical protein [Salmonella enterica]EBI9230146.1 hypothetical protein [Salmonella enterica]EBJ1005256.1 hypothetical protein [Salmonella enterica]EBJ1201212.1 hypothetical protein [Salmonella enterica]EBN9016389.1 hypothetical protein [Salmonella enterica]
MEDSVWSLLPASGYWLSLLLCSLFFRLYVCWLISLPGRLYKRPGISCVVDCLQLALFRVYRGVNAFYSHSYF